jgi:hypothetical protein
MKPGDLSAAACRLAAAISQIEMEAARLNGKLPANGFGAIVPSADVPTAPMVDAAAELPTDSTALSPPVDLSGRKIVSLPARKRSAAQRSLRKQR